MLGGQTYPAAGPVSSRSPHRVGAEERVDLNHASLDELLKVPGMTRTWAERIVRFRPYRTRLDLLQEGILSAAAYNRIKDAVIAHHEKK